ncbi:FtsJ-domain-containing protein [Eremomyces bilateralis CBS 781.70]|uniref:rRNA methyltransferase 2, mitochondrial n=1 Tax=Eremomyces bilateralis CBS 781.70 TaxID=1392243 RepID=A0A6G1FTE4_9PEZI|nr:FtsJ-domain-containing protein [Eremomyces bilateralis CBS 781.70]KAF1809006.1 FtsJ-domain-containing protein [Eremomyces bilateralis CBS 781.70]
MRPVLLRWSRPLRLLVPGPRCDHHIRCGPGPQVSSVLARHALNDGCPLQLSRSASSSSSSRWKQRQFKDQFTREAKVQGLKSRAAFKLLEIDEKHHLFKRGATVIDLGYAPGSWSQVAISRTQPNGRVVGIDMLPAQPPRGVSTIQGNFLSPAVQAEVRTYVQDPARGRPIQRGIPPPTAESETSEERSESYIDMDRHLAAEGMEPMGGVVEELEQAETRLSTKEKDVAMGRVVDVVLSDMSAPWPQTTGFSVNSVSDAYTRMMNSSGNSFRDHAGSMDLCMAALTFSFDTLKTGGHFVCKFYQGSEEKAFEAQLKRLFEKVHREKPKASRGVRLCYNRSPVLGANSFSNRKRHTS